VDERGALLGVGGCVDTRGLAADSAPVIPVNLSSCTRRSRRQRGAAAIRRWRSGLLALPISGSRAGTD